MNNQWYIGQRVVCVEAMPLPYQSLCVGQVYVIDGIYQCVHRTSVLNVGVMSPRPGWSGYTRLDCECRVYGNWHGDERFRPLDALTETMERIESEGAPVEHPELLPA